MVNNSTIPGQPNLCRHDAVSTSKTCASYLTDLIGHKFVLIPTVLVHHAIGSNVEISVGNTLNLIRELMHSDAEFITEAQRLQPERSEVFRLCCDKTKIYNV